MRCIRRRVPLEDIMKTLSKEQKEVVMTKEGNIRVIAGAGSGKTYTVIGRVRNIIEEHGIDPKNILMITYTKTGAEEMVSRLPAEYRKSITASTIHALAFRELKECGHYSKMLKPELKRNWKNKISIALVSSPNKFNKIGLGLKNSCGLDSADILKFIENQKNIGVGVEEIDSYVVNNSFNNMVNKQFQKIIYNKYEVSRKAEKITHFEDMIFDFYKKLKNDENYRNQIKNKYKYIIVDEGQDTSIIQYKILELLDSGNTMIVGDHRQSIYGSFAYAGLEDFLDFDKRFNAKTFELTNNYRSSSNIVKLGNKIAKSSKNEKFQDFKDCVAIKEEKNKNHFFPCLDSSDQVSEIANIIKEKVKEGYKYKDFFVLYRTNKETIDFEIGFTNRDIPFVIDSDKSFYDRFEIERILSFFYYINNLKSDEHCEKCLITFDNFLGKKAINELKSIAYQFNMSLYELIKSKTKHDFFKNPKNKRKVQILEEFKTLTDRLIRKKNNIDLFISDILTKTKYKTMISSTGSEEVIENRKESYKKFIDYAKGFKDVESLIANIEYLRAESLRKKKDKSRDSVRLMSIHKSKGLENKIVFIPNLMEGNLPHTKSIEEQSKTVGEFSPAIEEERRILYVGVTRAEEKLYCTCPVFTGKKKDPREPSRFFKDMLNDEERDIFNLKFQDMRNSLS